MTKLVFATLVCALCTAAAASVAAADPAPAVGTTMSVTCAFDATSGATNCRQSTVTVTAGPCVTGGRLYERDEVDSVRKYRGNAVLPGLDGVTVDGSYADALRPHARLFYDSGPHAFSESFPVDDGTCAV